MADDLLTYEPTERFNTQNGLYGNHFKFVIVPLPDLSFFAQVITLPSVMTSAVGRSTPFAKIKEVGDHLEYGTVTVNYLVDASFKVYTSLLWWLQGYGFPHSYEEVKAFRETRTARLVHPRPIVREIEKTNATLYLLEPDTEKIVVEFQFVDIFPIQLGEIEFSSMDNEPPQLRCTATFACTLFDVVPAV
jgi:hypothetical protein